MKFAHLRKLSEEDRTVLAFRAWLGVQTNAYDGTIRKVLQTSPDTETAQNRLLKMVHRPSEAEKELTHG